MALRTGSLPTFTRVKLADNSYQTIVADNKKSPAHYAGTAIASSTPVLPNNKASVFMEEKKYGISRYKYILICDLWSTYIFGI